MSQETAELLRSIRGVGERYERISAGSGVTGLCVPTLPAEVRQNFVDEETLWKPWGEVLKPGSRSTVTQIEFGGVPYVLKQYKCMVLRRRLRYAVTRTRSMQSWEQGQLMSELGLRVVRPLAILIERRFGIPARSKLLMESVRGESIMKVMAQEGGFSRLEGALPHLQEYFVKMAECHLIHGDLTGSNVLLDEENRPSFIDLDGSRYIRSASAYRRARVGERRSFMKNWKTRPEVDELFQSVMELV